MTIRPTDARALVRTRWASERATMQTSPISRMDQTNPSPAALIAAIRAIVPTCIAFAGGEIGEATSSPFAEETEAIRCAVVKRRREFIAGRQYARSAMSQLGMDAAPIAVLPSRAPAWPSGLTGSISHSGDVCVAVVAMESTFAGVGIDVESSTPLPIELYATVCRPSELSVTAPGSIDQAKMLFVVKEAFFKLYHPITNHFLDFLDVSVRLDPARGTFSLELLEGLPAVLGCRTFAGVCGHADAYCFAFVALRRR
jgi:enterobactin synthetase component D / holo-[acyl-carrier protein] synthase